MALTRTESAVWRLSRQGKGDGEISQLLGISREWSCKTRARVARKVQALNAFGVAHGESVDVRNIDLLLIRLGEIAGAVDTPRRPPVSPRTTKRGADVSAVA